MANATTTVAPGETCYLDDPFLYKNPNGSYIPTGYLDQYGTCIVSGSDCLTELECCSISESVEKGQNVANNTITIGCVAVLVLFFYSRTKVFDAAKKRQEEETGEAKLSFQQSKTWYAALFQKLSIYVAIGSAITVPLILLPSLQENLYPKDRTALLAANAFLVPLEELFQFLEDTMTVRINFAIGSAQYDQLNVLINVGLLAGFVLGSVAAGIASLLTVNRHLFAELVYPGASLDAKNYVGCALLPDTSIVWEEIGGYWLLRAWSWPLIFMTLCLNGFFIGTGRFELYGWPLALNAACYLGIWFSKYQDVENRLTLLGWASLAAPLVSFSFMMIAFVADVKMREKFGLTLWCCPCLGKKKPDAGGMNDALLNDTSGYTGLVMDETDDPKARSRSVQQTLMNGPNLGGGQCQLLMEGMKAMILEMSCQMFVTIGVYVAAYRGIAVSYKIAALQSAMPAFGTSWAVGLGFFLKIIGSNVVARQNYRLFMHVCLIAIVTGTLYGAVALIALEPHREDVADGFGKSACGYATTEGCSEIYHDIFTGKNGNGSLKDSFQWFGIAAFMQCFFPLIKAALYCCLDFTFMSATSVFSLVAVFMPAIFIATTENVSNNMGQANAIFVAMNAPYVFLILAFGGRLVLNIRTMLSGGTGPWARHMQIEGEAERAKEKSTQNVMLTSSQA